MYGRGPSVSAAALRNVVLLHQLIELRTAVARRVRVVAKLAEDEAALATPTAIQEYDVTQEMSVRGVCLQVSRLLHSLP